MSGKNVAKKQTTAAVKKPVSKDYSSNVSNEDLMLPRVELLQPLSPAVQDDSLDLKAGQIVNNITKEALPEPCKIIPVYLTKHWIRWRDRSEGGGMIWRSSDPTDERVIREGSWNGEQKPLATAYLNFLCLVEGGDMPIVLSFCNTSYKAGRKLLTLTKMSSGPIYASKFNIGSLKKQNDKGVFYVFTVDKAGPANEEEQKKAAAIQSTFAGRELNFEQDGGQSNERSVEGLSDEF